MYPPKTAPSATIRFQPPDFQSNLKNSFNWSRAVGCAHDAEVFRDAEFVAEVEENEHEDRQHRAGHVPGPRLGDEILQVNQDVE